MHRGSILLMIVPGRADRAFYKRFFICIARNLGFQFVDLDAKAYRMEKEDILNQIYSLPRATRNDRVIERGSAVIKIMTRNKDIAIVILPAERSVLPISNKDKVTFTRIASSILGYQASLIKPTVNVVVVAEDAEDMSLSERLESLYNSLMAYGVIEVEKELISGKAFRLFNLKRPKDVKLMLLAQGIEQVTIVSKHAIEDFILYSYTHIINDIKNYVRT